MKKLAVILLGTQKALILIGFLLLFVTFSANSWDLTKLRGDIVVAYGNGQPAVAITMTTAIRVGLNMVMLRWDEGESTTALSLMPEELAVFKSMLDRAYKEAQKCASEGTISKQILLKEVEFVGAFMPDANSNPLPFRVTVAFGFSYLSGEWGLDLVFSNMETEAGISLNLRSLMIPWYTIEALKDIYTIKALRELESKQRRGE